MFTQCDTYHGRFGDLSQYLIEGVRHYGVDDQTVYPSVTSVLSFQSRERIAAWKQKVGLEVANAKSKRACNRGTRAHRVWEEYLRNGDYKALDEYNIPLIQMMFNSSKTHLDSRLDNIYQQETRMFSHRLCLAGTVDLICEVDGELAIVDFKTAEKAKPEEWLEDYFVQLSAYWAMFSEATGVVPKKLVVFLVGENGDVQIVERRNIMNYLTILKDYVSKFIQHRDAHS